MKPHTRELSVRVKVDGPDRELAADVLYLISVWYEAHPYGSSVAYEERSDFTVAMIDYETLDMTAAEKKLLDDRIKEGPYE